MSRRLPCSAGNAGGITAIPPTPYTPFSSWVGPKGASDTPGLRVEVSWGTPQGNPDPVHLPQPEGLSATGTPCSFPVLAGIPAGDHHAPRPSERLPPYRAAGGGSVPQLPHLPLPPAVPAGAQLGVAEVELPGNEEEGAQRYHGGPQGQGQVPESPGGSHAAPAPCGKAGGASGAARCATCQPCNLPDVQHHGCARPQRHRRA